MAALDRKLLESIMAIVKKGWARAFIVLMVLLVGAAEAQVGRRQKLPPLPRGGQNFPKGQNRIPRPGGRNGLDRQRPGLAIERRQRLEHGLIKELNLTESQWQRMGEIQRSYDPDITAAGRRVRLAKRALDEAIMNRRSDEAEIDRLSESLAAAQSDSIKVNSRMRTEVRNLLTQEQVSRLNQLMREFQQKQREERRRNDRQRTQNPPETELEPPDRF